MSPCKTEVLFALLTLEMLLLQCSVSCRSRFGNTHVLRRPLPVGLNRGQSAESFTSGGVC